MKALRCSSGRLGSWRRSPFTGFYVPVDFPPGEEGRHVVQVVVDPLRGEPVRVWPALSDLAGRLAPTPSPEVGRQAEEGVLEGPGILPRHRPNGPVPDDLAPEPEGDLVLLARLG